MFKIRRQHDRRRNHRTRQATSSCLVTTSLCNIRFIPSAKCAHLISYYSSFILPTGLSIRRDVAAPPARHIPYTPHATGYKQASSPTTEEHGKTLTKQKQKRSPYKDNKPNN